MAAPTIVTGILTGGTNSHTTTSEEVNAVPTDFVSEGVIGALTNTSGVAPSTGAFAVNASGTPDANINISTGVAYVNATPTSQNSQNVRVKCTVTGTLAISANASGSTKYDWIYISVSASAAANPAVGADNVATIVASRSTSASSDDGTPPTYGYPIAVVTVANGFTTITNGNIRDNRTSAVISATATGTSQDWYALGYTPSTVTNNGNRSYTCTYSNVDLTSFLSVGMRLKHTRLVTAPTQCTDLESGSSQYFSAATGTLAGVTFTDDFTCSAWVKLESYTGIAQYIVARGAAASGFGMLITIAGQLEIFGGTGSAFDVADTYQSIPLNKWVHVAATMDMSASTATMYIDGVLVPSVYTNSGATSLTQTGDLTIGRASASAAGYFDGKLAQVAVFSSVLSAATIRSYMSQTLAGNESTLVSAYSFNNTILDLNTTNNNDLTANAGALATNADSPFGQQADGTTAGTTEYAIITKTAFSTNTTLTVQVPEGNAIPTSGGVSAVSYSTQKVPYGFPAQRGKWQLLTLIGTNLTTASAAAWTLQTGAAINVPIGDWEIGWKGTTQFAYGAGAGADSAFSMGSTSVPEGDLYIRNQAPGTASTTYTNASGAPSKAVSLSAATTYSMYAYAISGSGGVGTLLMGAPITAASGPGFKLIAELAHL